jgi:ribosomal protein L17
MLRSLSQGIGSETKIMNPVRWFKTSKQYVSQLVVKASGIRSDVNQQIIKAIANTKGREAKQDALYNEYVKGICSENNNLVNISKFLKKTSLVEPYNVLFSLYNYILQHKKSFHQINMFSLPMEKTIAVIEEKKDNPKTYDELYDIYCEYLNKINKNSEFKRFTVFSEWYNLYTINRNNDYDLLSFGFIKKNSKGENTSLFDNNSKYTNNEDHPTFIHLVESVNKTGHGMSNIFLRKMLEIQKNAYIGKFHGVVIENKFDGSNIYDSTNYDNEYGVGTFHAALIKHLNYSIELSGNESISYEMTIDLIKDNALRVTRNKITIANKITNDLINLSKHSLFDTEIEIGQLMDKYEITESELLYAMACCYNMTSTIDCDDFTLNNLKKMTEDSFDIDFFKQMQLFVHLRKQKGDEQWINMNLFEKIINMNSLESEKNNGYFYKCLLWLMQAKH